MALLPQWRRDLPIASLPALAQFSRCVIRDPQPRRRSPEAVMIRGAIWASSKFTREAKILVLCDTREL
jgi:hypothetical protein